MISVIIPVFNVEKYLRECLDSVANQTYSDLEVLVIDDGSKDSSPQICDEYAAADSRFIVIHKENGGVSSARNTGIENAHGNLIAFVDADDVLDLDMYEILVHALETTDSDIAACSYKNEYSKSFQSISKHEVVPEVVCFDTSEKSLESMTSKQNSIEGFVFNKVWRREALEGIRFKTDIAIIEDAAFTWEVVSQISRSCFVNLPMYHYRIIPTSAVRNSSLDKYLGALYVYESLIDSAKKIAPGCLDGLCTDYIIWNIKTLERMIYMKKPDLLIYRKAKENIVRVGEYIDKCGMRHKYLVKGVLKSWKAYRSRAVLVWNLKKSFLRILK